MERDDTMPLRKSVLLKKFNRFHPHANEVDAFRPDAFDLLSRMEVSSNGMLFKDENFLRASMLSIGKFKQHGTRALNDFSLKYGIMDDSNIIASKDIIKLDKKAIKNAVTRKEEDEMDSRIASDLFSLASSQTSSSALDNTRLQGIGARLAGSNADDAAFFAMLAMSRHADESNPDADLLFESMVNPFSTFRPPRHLFRKAIMENWVDENRVMDTGDVMTRLIVKQFVHTSTDKDKPFFSGYTGNDGMRTSIIDIIGSIISLNPNNGEWNVTLNNDEYAEDFAHVPLQIKLNALLKYKGEHQNYPEFGKDRS